MKSSKSQKLKRHIFTTDTKFTVFITPLSHPNGFYWVHQCSWSLAPANSMQVSNIQSDDCNRK